jgi:GntP family gluconate:H+ symporter
MWSVLLLVASIALIVVLTTQLRLHPFAALLLAAFFYGTLAGMPPTEIVTAINDGFGQTIGSIGIVIVAGTIIGAFLHHSGAAQVLATGFVRLAGPKRVPVAMGAVGYVVSMPVFCDSGFVLLSPINRALAAKHGVSLAACAVALSLGLYATHAMVPPTPGPVAAAGIIGADLGIVIGVGAAISIVALSAGIWFAYRFASRVELTNENTNGGRTDSGRDPERPPSTLNSVLPILVPMLLIVGRTFAELPTQPFGTGTAAELLSFLGQPAIALSIGVVAALRLPHKFSRKMLSATGWFGDAVKSAAVIIVITGAGGAFGKVIQSSGVADSMHVELLSGAAGILLPFFIAAAIKTAQGSSTVAMITTAGIIAPLLGSLGLDAEIAKAMVVVAIGAGSMVASHANDSYFWVVTQFSGMSVNQGYRLQTLGSAVQGVTAAVAIWILSLFVL